MKKIVSLFIAVILTASLFFSVGVFASAEPLLGDVNGDGFIDNKDVVTLFRFISGNDVKVVEGNCDVNRDGETDNKDVVELFRYMSEDWPHFHKYGEWTVLKEATCTEPGERERRCEYGETQTQTISAKGHSYGKWTVTKEATCTEDGEQEQVCSVCGAKNTQPIYSSGHAYGKWTVAREATCTKDGVQERKCAVCGDVQELTIEATGHTDSPVCGNCGANIRRQLIAAIKDDVKTRDDNVLVLYSDDDSMTLLAVNDDGSLVVAEYYGKVYFDLLIDDTDVINFYCDYDDTLYIAGRSSESKKAFTADKSYLTADVTNIPLDDPDGPDVLEAMEKIAVYRLTDCLASIDVYLILNGYPFTCAALGYTNFEW